MEPLDSDVSEFARVLRGERHTLKRSLTDPRLFSGIGNGIDWSKIDTSFIGQGAVY